MNNSSKHPIKWEIIFSIITSLILLCTLAFSIYIGLEQKRIVRDQNEATREIELSKLNQADIANEVAQISTDIERNRGRVEFTHVFISDYIQGDEETQSIVLEVLRELFPTETLEYENILKKYAKTDTVREKVDQLEDSIENERLGFISILEGNLGEAREYFRNACEASPAYHNVDEIYNKILTEDIVDEYNQASQIDKENIKKSIIEEILQKYYWGMEDEIKKQYEEYLIKVFIDEPRENDIISGKITLYGWALRLNSREGPGISNIKVFDEYNGERVLLGEAIYGYHRPGVEQLYNNPNFLNSGFKMEINTHDLENGPHQLYVYAYDNDRDLQYEIINVLVQN